MFPRRRFPHGAAPIFPLFVPLLNRTQARADVSECPRTIPKCSNVSGDPIAFQTSMQREFFHPLLTTWQRLLHCSNQAAPHANSTPLYILVHLAPASALRLPSAMQMYSSKLNASILSGAATLRDCSVPAMSKLFTQRHIHARKGQHRENLWLTCTSAMARRMMPRT